GAAGRCAGHGRVLHHDGAWSGRREAGRRSRGGPRGARGGVERPPGGPRRAGGGRGEGAGVRGAPHGVEGGRGGRRVRTGAGRGRAGGLRRQPSGCDRRPGRPSRCARDGDRAREGSARGQMSQKRMSPHILISDQEPGFPYSKGLMASRVMVTGLSPVRAYQIAESIEQRLVDRRVSSISSEELFGLAVEVIDDLAGDRYAKNFLRWRELEALDIPLVILIGGTTGVGKSTIATQLAARLGIVRVVATDAVREVMRAMFSERLMPTLYRSSFEAGEALREPPTRDAVVV